MNNLNRKTVRRDAPMEDAAGFLIVKPSVVRVSTAPKRKTMADFLQSDMSARKKIYMEALAQSVKDQQEVIDEASRLSPA